MELRNPTILAIDDNRDKLIILKALINDVIPDARVITALDGKHGIKLASTEDPDVILLDIVMPEMDGYEVCKKLNEDEILRDIPVVFLTAENANQQSRVKALEYGAKAFLSSPLNETELLAVIRTMTKLKAANEYKKNETDRLSTIVVERTVKLEQELTERKKAEQSLIILNKQLKESQLATLNLMEDLREEIEMRKDIEKALKSSQAHLSNALIISGSGHWEYDITTDTFTFSDEFYRIFRTTAEQMGGYTMSSSRYAKLFVDPEDLSIVAEETRKAIETNDPAYNRIIEHRIKYADGETGYIAVRIQVIKDNKGNTIKTFGVNQDITERKHTEDEIRELSMRQKVILNEIPDIVMEVDNNKIYKWANPAGYNFFGDDVIGKEADYYFKGEQSTYRQVQPLFNGNPELFYVESWQRRKDGEKRLLAWWCRSLTDSNGHVTGALSTARDITTQKKEETELRQFRHIIQHSGWGMAIIYPESTALEYVNPAFEMIHGYEPGEITNMNLAQFFDPESFAELPGHINSVHEKGYHKYESIHVRKDGSRFPCLTHVTAYKDENGKVLFRAATLEDITDSKHISAALIESENKFSKVFHNSPNSMEITKVSDNKTIEVNDAWLKITGFTRESVIGKTAMDLGFWENIEDRNEFLRIMKTTGHANNIDAKLLTNKGEITGLLSAVSVELQNEQYILWEFLDLTDRIRTQEALKISEERYRKLVQQSPDGIVIHSEGKIVFINLAGLKLVGAKSESEVLGKNAIDFVHPDYRPKTSERIRTSINNKMTAPVAEEKFIRLDGNIIDVEVLGMPLEYNGKPAMQVIIRDISVRKHSEEQLMFQAHLLSEIGEAIISTNTAGKITYMNNAAEILYGLPFNKALGRKITEVAPTSISKSQSTEMISTLKQGKNWSGECSVKTLDGRSFPVLVTNSPVLNKKGELEGIVGISKDISDLKRAEILHVIQYNIANAIVKAKYVKELSDTIRDELNKLLDATNLFIALYNESSGLLSSAYINDSKADMPETWPAARSLTGMVVEQNKSFLLSKKDIHQLADEGKIDLFGSRAEAWLGVPLEIEGRILGAIVVQSYNNPVAYNQESVEILEIIANQLSVYIERQRTQENAVILSKGIDQSPVCIIITDNDGQIEYINPKFVEVTGYSYEDIIGNNPKILKSGEHTKEFYDHLWNTILSGNDWQGEFHNKKKNGEMYWENAIISPIINENGVITHYIGIKEDITEKKRMIEDLIAAKEKAEDSDRLKSSFLANISHEIRTPMNAIIGFSDLLIRPGLAAEKLVQYTSVIKQRSYDLLNIINDILDISIIEAGQMKINEGDCDIEEILSDLYYSFKVVWVDSGKNKINFMYENKLKDKNTSIITDYKRLRQIISNLLNNAFRFTPLGSVQFGCELNKDNELQFFVSDTGIGIESDKQEVIFQRFRQAEETTTRIYGGTGLGLSICRGLLDLLNGKIWVVSEPGKGSNFYFTLPYKISAKYTPQKSPVKELKYSWGKNKVLLVEDDNFNAEYMKSALDETNVQITHVIYGKEAVDIVKSKQHFDLVLLDIKLPDIEGYEVARQIKSFSKKIPIIAETAFASDIHRKRCIEAGCDEYISKPIDKKELFVIMSKFLKGS